MIQTRKETYQKALVELYEIISLMSTELQNRIPEEVKDNILHNMDENYDFEIDEEVPIFQQLLLPETKALLSILYTKYLCNEEEKRKWEEYDAFYLKKKEEKKIKQYAEVNIIPKEENIKETPTDKRNVSIVLTKKQPFWMKMVNKINTFLQNIFK